MIRQSCHLCDDVDSGRAVAELAPAPRPLPDPFAVRRVAWPTACALTQRPRRVTAPQRRLGAMRAALQHRSSSSSSRRSSPQLDEKAAVALPAAGDRRYAQLERDGYCVVPRVLTDGLLQLLRTTACKMVDAEPETKRQYFRSQGSMIGIPGHPRPLAGAGDAAFSNSSTCPAVFRDLITWRPALTVLREMGFLDGGATFTDGYIISKPPDSPPLFWHYDWFSWDMDEDWQPRPQQVFFMYYLQDTTKENGCLRVIPGSHVASHPLHAMLRRPHNQEYSRAADAQAVQYALRADEVSVPCQAGDLVVGDARLLHAAHANRSGCRRTVITLWIQPEFQLLSRKAQAQMLLKTHPVPQNWLLHGGDQLRAMMPAVQLSAFTDAAEVDRCFPQGVPGQLRPPKRGMALQPA